MLRFTDNRRESPHKLPVSIVKERVYTRGVDRSGSITGTLVPSTSARAARPEGIEAAGRSFDRFPPRKAAQFTVRPQRVNTRLSIRFAAPARLLQRALRAPLRASPRGLFPAWAGSNIPLPAGSDASLERAPDRFADQAAMPRKAAQFTDAPLRVNNIRSRFAPARANPGAAARTATLPDRSFPDIAAQPGLSNPKFADTSGRGISRERPRFPRTRACRPETSSSRPRSRPLWSRSAAHCSAARPPAR